MKILLSLLLAVLLAACTTIAKVEGDQVVNGKLRVTVPAAWNKINDPWNPEPYITWTQEGLPLDHLRFWGGVQAGQSLMTKPMVFLRNADQRAPRVPTFKAGLSPEKLVSLFEELYATSGAVNVTRVEPTRFAGQPGVRFEFTLARRDDEVLMRGVTWVAVRHDPAQGEELFAATFVAPKLAFYDRLLPMAEAVVKTARIGAQGS